MSNPHHAKTRHAPLHYMSMRYEVDDPVILHHGRKIWYQLNTRQCEPHSQSVSGNEKKSATNHPEGNFLIQTVVWTLNTGNKHSITQMALASM